MARSITFDDGTVISGETDAELVRKAEQHIRSAHPQLAGRLSPAEILSMARANEKKGEWDVDERRL